MPITDVLAGLPVTSLDAALDWYERLFGRPPDARPMDGLADWHFADTSTVQLVEDAERAGGGLLTLTTSDVQAQAEALRQRGVDIEPVDETTSEKVLFASVSDPEGNLITLVERKPGA